MTERPRKYRNVPTEVDGRRFDSKAEARRYGELKMLQRAGLIEALECQPRYPLTAHGEVICTYVADFSYVDRNKRCRVAEDTKGFETAEFKLKAKMFRAQYRDVELRVTRA